MAEIGRRYLAGMEFTDNQYLISRHTDTEHEHIHILANRITHGGGVVSDSMDYKRQEVLMRAIEREFGLSQLAYFSDRGRLFQADRGRQFTVIADELGKRA